MASIPAQSFTVLWDNDGVLVETEGLYYQATKTVLQTVGVELSVQQFQDISLRRGESTFQLAAARGIHTDVIAGLRVARDRLYAELLGSRCCVIEGVEGVLSALRGRVRMGVVTSSARQHFEIAHSRSNLLAYFEFVLARGDYAHSKPHPEPYLTALKRFSIRPQECLVVEDSERGLAAAVAAGLECLIVLSEWSREGDFSRASRVLGSVSEVTAEVLRRATA